jgi:DNA-directed RNA polymerase specialized sigma24 family protein
MPIYNDHEDLDQAIKRLPDLTACDRRAEAARIAGQLFPQIRAWAPGWARRAGDLSFRHVDDAAQEAAVAVLEALHAFSDGTHHQSVSRWMPYLYALGQNTVSKHLKSAAGTGFAGRTNLERRLARIPRTRERLVRELRREPTAGEIVAALNAEMTARQADPARHGSLLSVDEVVTYLRRSR